ncbi:CoA transferase [Sandarakinorhabdus limnophila]|uniref:CoA transferase n=1 Tax=Sandarakinorhabdus limnophila TaxID=210512 RepID=UPI002352759E|nr:CoA transferase [Sandarakinorhabdus limnophila]
MYQLLSGLRVVEAAAFVAGPTGGLYLAQMGAEVIRIDQIGGGPDYKRWPLTEAGDSLYWEGLNKAKRSIQIDLSRAEGRELAVALATAPGDEAGLFLTNFPVDGFLSHAALAARRPDIITARIMGWADGKPALDYTVNAAVGVPAMTGPVGDTRPVNAVLPAWDLLGGTWAAFAMVSALHRRRQTGEGAEIRVPLSDLAATSMSHLGFAAEALLQGDRGRLGNDLFGAFGRDFATADGQRIYLVAITPKQWRGLVAALGLGDAVASVEAATGADFTADEGARFTHRGLLFPLFEAAMAAQKLVELGPRLDAAGVTWGPYQTLAEAVHGDARLFTANPIFQTITHKSGLTYPAAGPAATLAGEPRGPVRPAPQLGADTDHVLGEVLGLSSSAIGALHDKGLVA